MYIHLQLNIRNRDAIGHFTRKINKNNNHAHRNGVYVCKVSVGNESIMKCQQPSPFLSVDLPFVHRAHTINAKFLMNPLLDIPFYWIGTCAAIECDSTRNCFFY